MAVSDETKAVIYAVILRCLLLILEDHKTVLKYGSLRMPGYNCVIISLSHALVYVNEYMHSQKKRDEGRKNILLNTTQFV